MTRQQAFDLVQQHGWRAVFGSPTNGDEVPPYAWIYSVGIPDPKYPLVVMPEMGGWVVRFQIGEGLSVARLVFNSQEEANVCAMTIRLHRATC